MIAPVSLFVYNRPDHTAKTLAALSENLECVDTDLFIFSDAPKVPEHRDAVTQVRELCRGVDGFRSVTLIERKENWGLAKSIIDGVSMVVQRFGRVIVLEDDLVVSSAFLSFMNQALDIYGGEKKVWHISGWSYPIEDQVVEGAFLWRGMNCWGWGTWADRWEFFTKDPQGLIETFSRKQKRDFDLGGTKVFWPQIVQNAQGKIDTWAIFWYATIFLNNGLCLNPRVSFVENIGHDGTGINCGTDSISQSRRLNTDVQISFPNAIAENPSVINAIRSYYRAQKRSLVVRIFNKLARIAFNRNLIR